MKEALKLALEALERIDLWLKARYSGIGLVGVELDAITAIKEALAQPEQEPVALRHSFDGYGYLYTDMGFGSGWIEWTKRSKKDAEPLYTTPPQRTWVGLTYEEAKEVYSCIHGYDASKKIAEAIEAKLKEKNHG